MSNEEFDLNDLSTTNVSTKSQSAISAELKARMDAHSEYVNTAYKIFKDNYKSSMRPTVISEIINGESIQLDPENILISIPPTIVHPDFERQKAFCKKNLYKYQLQAIQKLYELEQRGFTTHPITGEKVISNGWQLYLPIGSGKSIIFEWIALWYRDIPKHPIIISTDGSHVPETDQMRWRDYPYYYENCGYIEGHANAVVTLKEYTQRRCTIILTHSHLVGQLQYYFQNDFDSRLLAKAHIEYYPSQLPDSLNVDKCDILVVTADSANVARLVELSHKEPFLRVIIDDYTSMASIDSFRQIYATSTIFVSGSGFNREEKDIPPVYYTLKFAPTKAISIVGSPEETYEGVFRDNIATMDLMGTTCDFALYEFIQLCETKCMSIVHPNGRPSVPEVLYPAIKSRPKLSNYLSLMYVLNNMFKLQGVIAKVEHDYVDGKLKTEEITYYREWKDMMRGPINAPPPTRKGIKSPYNSRSQPPPLNDNMLYNILFDEDARTSPNAYNDNVTPVVIQKCMSCGKEPTTHGDFGFIASCCGAFFCCECLKHMCTHEIVDTDSNTVQVDRTNYYCSCCRGVNPRYIFNISKKRGTGHMYSFELADEYFDVHELVGHIKFDYTYYMMLYGFKPKHFDGKRINIANDIRQGLVSCDEFKRGTIPEIVKLLPKDQLAMQCLECINNVMAKLNFIPQQRPTILFYGCPQYMAPRVRNVVEQICSRKTTKTIPLETFKNSIVFVKDVGQLIGLHANILAIIQWVEPSCKDELQQLMGRILRLNSWDNKIYFYITASSIDFN